MGLIAEAMEDMFYVQMVGEFTQIEDELQDVANELNQVSSLVDTVDSTAWMDTTSLVTVLKGVATSSENAVPNLATETQLNNPLQERFDEYFLEFQALLRDVKLFRFRDMMGMLGQDHIIASIPDNIKESEWPYLDFSAFEEFVEELGAFPVSFLYVFKPYFMAKVKADIESQTANIKEMEIAKYLNEIRKKSTTSFDDKIKILEHKAILYNEAGFKNASYFLDRINTFNTYLPYDADYNLDFNKIINSYQIPPRGIVNLKICFAVVRDLGTKFDFLSMAF